MWHRILKLWKSLQYVFYILRFLLYSLFNCCLCYWNDKGGNRLIFRIVRESLQIMIIIDIDALIFHE